MQTNTPGVISDVRVQVERREYTLSEFHLSTEHYDESIAHLENVSFAYQLTYIIQLFFKPHVPHVIYHLSCFGKLNDFYALISPWFIVPHEAYDELNVSSNPVQSRQYYIERVEELTPNYLLFVCVLLRCHLQGNSNGQAYCSQLVHTAQSLNRCHRYVAPTNSHNTKLHLAVTWNYERPSKIHSARHHGLGYGEYAIASTQNMMCHKHLIYIHPLCGACKSERDIIENAGAK